MRVPGREDQQHLAAKLKAQYSGPSAALELCTYTCSAGPSFLLEKMKFLLRRSLSRQAAYIA